MIGQVNRSSIHMWHKGSIKSLCLLIEKQYGIRCDENKLISNMPVLNSIQTKAGFLNEEDFINFLTVSPKSQELIEIAENFLIHETYFFREFRQLQVFSELLLPEIVECKKRKGDLTLSLWSAACSSGEEAYTLAIILNEFLDRRVFPSIRIYGTDLDRAVIEKAKKGVYSGRTLKDVPPGYLGRYFLKEKDESFSVGSQIKGMCEFRVENLLLSKPTSSQRYDIIFCRNAFIYFSDVNKKNILQYFSSCLKADGILVIGSSDSISKIESPFTTFTRGGFTFYSKGNLVK